jgi:2-phosphoglycolate phosphatase
MNPHTDIQAVLFDLDGTFADTAPDLAYALNATLDHFSCPTLSLEQIRPAVSHGGAALIRLGFQMEPDDPGFEQRRQYLLQVYLDNICKHTRLFDGMEQVLNALAANDIPWGIVTNKPAWLTDPLMAALPMPQGSECIVSGDTCTRNKPHPEPILHACALLNAAPTKTLYVGDAERDLVAGRVAGNTTVCALFGYIQPEDQPDQWPADHYIDQAIDLLALMGLDG